MVEEVTASVQAYDAALSEGDLDGVDSWFWHSALASRVGERGSVVGYEAIAAARRTGAAPSEPREDEALTVVPLTEHTAVALLLYERPSSGRRGRRTQVWLRTDDGWRIAHAHLSLET